MEGVEGADCGGEKGRREGVGGGLWISLMRELVVALSTDSLVVRETIANCY